MTQMKNLRRLDLRWNDFDHYPTVLEPLIQQGCMVHW
jgi:hypothetical protein